MPRDGFWAAAGDEPDAVAVVAADGSRTPRGALVAASNRLVHALRARGLCAGDAIVVALENRVEALEIFFAAAQAGMYYAPISGRSTASEIAVALALPEAKVFFGESPAPPSDVPSFVVGAEYAALLAEEPATAPEARTAGETLFSTGGTTGAPRVIKRPLSGLSPERRAAASAKHLLGVAGIRARSSGVHLVTSPLHHSASLLWCTDQLQVGHRVVLMDRWTPEGMLAAIEEHRVTSTFVVPTHFHRLLALPEDVKARYDLSSLRHVVHGGAPCPVDVKRAMLAWWGPVIYEVYSAAELASGLRVGPEEWLAHPGTVGRAPSNVTILRDDGTPCAAREVGTIHVGGVAPGDLGWVDEEGYLFFSDRKVDVVITGGVNVYPAEIEAVLAAHEAVADAAVFGVPDDEWGEQVKAVVELEAGVEPSAELVLALRAHCKARLVGAKVPKTIDFTPSLPRDATGKLRKRVLRDPYWEGRGRKI